MGSSPLTPSQGRKQSEKQTPQEKMAIKLKEKKESVKKNTPKRGEKKELKEMEEAPRKRDTPSRRKRVISDEVFLEEETLDKGEKGEKVGKVVTEEKEEELKTKAKPKRG